MPVYGDAMNRVSTGAVHFRHRRGKIRVHLRNSRSTATMPQPFIFAAGGSEPRNHSFGVPDFVDTTAISIMGSPKDT